MQRIRFFGVAGASICFLAACQTTLTVPAENAHICEIFADNPSWPSHLQRASSRWDISRFQIMAFMYQESRFVSDARPPVVEELSEHEASGAWGYAQATRVTWEEYLEEIGTDRVSRENFRDSADFIGWYNRRTHIALGIPETNTVHLYYAFHEGRGGYQRGTYETPGRAWLREVGKKVEAKEALYRRQSFNCPDSNRKRFVRPIPR
ncbi:MAG: hypothetical protein ACR2PW_00210 [Gammaproteobacteria bacterium]